MKKTSIKGLIIKDLLNLSHYKASFFVILFIFIGLGLLDKTSLSFLPIMLMAMIGMIGLSTFSYDEISKADKYLLTLPTNKKELVKSKYVLVILMILISAAISLLVTVCISQIVYKEMVNFGTLFTTLISGIFGISLIECIQIPSIYKWGAEKGRIQMFILILVVCALVGGFIYLLTTMGLTMQLDTNKILQILESFGTYVVLALICIMYFFSYHLSCKVYEKKEL